MNFQYIKNISTLELDADKCTGCGICLTVCPRMVLAKNDSDCKIHISNMDNCMECGACMLNCPFGALTVEPGTGCAIAILSGKLKGSKPCC